MSRSLELAVASARAREVPWDSKRAERVGRSLAEERGRSRANTGVTRFTFASLGSAALLALCFRLSSAVRDGDPPEHHLDVSAVAVPGEEAAFVEPRWGDAGYDASEAAHTR
jgi:hypothetical protein